LKNENGNAFPYHVFGDDDRAIRKWGGGPNPSHEMTHGVALQDAYLLARGRMIDARPTVGCNQHTSLAYELRFTVHTHARHAKDATAGSLRHGSQTCLERIRPGLSD
jgi:hypothetical protein